MNEKTQRQTMSVSETAEVIGVSTTSIYKMVRMKQLPHVRIGAKILMNRSVIEAWLRGEVQTTN